MSIIETIYKHRKHRVCVGNNGVQKIWNRYSFWTHASDVEFDDGSTLEEKISNVKGTTNDINGEAGYAADVSLVRSIRDALKNLIDSLSNVVNGINNRLGGLTFYEDFNGKWVVGADSVPKKLGSTRQEEWMVVAEEWFCDLSGPNNNFINNGGYIMDQKGWRWTLAKDYDIKALRGDYAQLTTDDFSFQVTSVLYFIDNMGHDHDEIELPGPSVHAYDPATGKLTVKSDICRSSSGAGSELVSMKIKIMICE